MRNTAIKYHEVQTARNAMLEAEEAYKRLKDGETDAVEAFKRAYDAAIADGESKRDARERATREYNRLADPTTEARNEYRKRERLANAAAREYLMQCADTVREALRGTVQELDGQPMRYKRVQKKLEAAMPELEGVEYYVGPDAVVMQLLAPSGRYYQSKTEIWLANTSTGNINAGYLTKRDARRYTLAELSDLAEHMEERKNDLAAAFDGYTECKKAYLDTFGPVLDEWERDRIRKDLF